MLDTQEKDLGNVQPWKTPQGERSTEKAVSNLRSKLLTVRSEAKSWLRFPSTYWECPAMDCTTLENTAQYCITNDYTTLEFAAFSDWSKSYGS